MQDRTSARQFDEIYLLLKKRLSPRRMQHTLGTAHMAVLLAERWGEDPELALTAALLHDIAKEQDHDAMLARIERHLQQEIHLDDRDFPAIWHALAGEIVVREEFGITSPKVGMAIRLHPTGDESMALLEKIIFIADYIEPTRTFEGVGELRKLSQENLDAAIDAAILQKTSHIRGKGRPLHIRSLRALENAERRTGRNGQFIQGRENS